MKVDNNQSCNTIINYYVSNAGDVNNDGLTPARATTVAGIAKLDLLRLCTLNFNRGEIFEIAISLYQPNIIVQPYGTGSDPIFSGSTSISGLTWTNEGDGTYSTPMSEPNAIYINGIKAKISETSAISITSYPATNQLGINNASVAGFATIVGARLNLKPRVWATEYLYNVNTYAGSVITLNQATVYQSSIVGTTFTLQGKKDFTMVTNGWAWDTGKLYIKTAVSPSTMDIRMSVYNNGIILNNRTDYATIKNIHLKDYYYNGIKRLNCHFVTTDSCTVENCGTGIVYTTSSFQATGGNVTNNQVFNCDCGMYVTATTNPTISNNTVYNIGMGLNVSAQLDPSITLVQNYGLYLASHATVSYNTVYNTAYTAVTISSFVECHHNVVHDFLQRFTDGGGIYSQAASGTTVTNTNIYNNIVYNGGATFCCGIYLDNRCVGYNVYNNVIYNVVDGGINVNWDTQYNVATDNIIVDCGECIRYRQGGAHTAWALNEGNVSLRNIFALRKTTQYDHYATVADGTINYNPYNNGGSSDNNYYISPYINRIAFHTDEPSMTLAQLQARYGTDANSTERVNWKTFVNAAQAAIDVKLVTNETSVDAQFTFGAGYIDVTGATITTVTVPAKGAFLGLLYP